MTDIERLQKTFGRGTAVTIRTSDLGGPVVVLTVGKETATVALLGAQVIAWEAGASPGIIWMSSEARLDTGRNARGGIPVCWPWFADHPTDKSKPAHGFARTRLWEVVASSANAEVASVSLLTRVADVDLWPHAADLRLDVTLGRSLSLDLTTVNTGSNAFPLSQALHTYFRVGDIADVRVDGLDGRTYLDKLDGFSRKVQDGSIRVEGEVDRIYLGDTSRISLQDQRLRRRIEIEGRGSRSAVVWNPWIEKSRRLGDMGREGYQSMLCIETANAGDDVLMIDPGAEHTLGVTYKVGPLAG